MSESQVNALIEAIRAQRTEALDAGARWFSLYIESQEKLKAAEADVARLTPVVEPKE